MEMLRQKPYLFGVITGFIVILNIVCVSLPFWMSIKGLNSVGPYESAHHGSNKVYQTNCAYEYMSQTECGYLQSLQISAVLTILFGAFSAILFFLPPKTFASFPVFVANTGVMGQVIFSLMTIVLFHYFKSNYYDDDGINQETPMPGESDVTYDAMFYLWITGTIISFLMASAGYSIINKTQYVRKGAFVNQA
jgi:hypothetical protein